MGKTEVNAVLGRRNHMRQQSRQASFLRFPALPSPQTWQKPLGHDRHFIKIVFTGSKVTKFLVLPERNAPLCMKNGGLALWTASQHEKYWAMNDGTRRTQHGWMSVENNGGRWPFPTCFSYGIRDSVSIDGSFTARKVPLCKDIGEGNCWTLN